MAGVTLEGFTKKRLSDIKLDIETSLKNALGENINTVPQSVFGQIIGIIAEREALEWEIMEQIYLSFYPKMAYGVNLDNLVAINGISRLKATRSYGYIDLYGTDGTVVPAGTIFSTSDNGNKFTLDYDTTISGVTVANVTSIEYGEISAVAGTLTKIETPIAGLDSVINSNDITLGTNEETDKELRIRREKIIGRNAQNLTDSLKSQLLLLSGVRKVAVIDNKTDTVDALGVPGRSFMAVVDGGSDKDIGNVIWGNTPQGIISYGNINVKVEDASKTLQNVYFSRPTIVPIYFTITITTDSSYIAGSDVAVANKVAEFGNSEFSLGDDVITSKFYTPINEVDGIVGIDILIGKSANPTLSDNIIINDTESSIFDTANISVVVQ